MCPGIAVAGGGGDGGGGSGGSSKKGKGKKGAGKKKGKKNAKGGKKKGKEGKKGKCGGGGKKGTSCTKHSKKPSAGDPVDVVSGEVYTFDHTDLFLPGFFNLQIDRSYSTDDRRRDIGFGWGWTHSLAWEMVVENGRLVVRDPDGISTDFPVMKEPGYQSSAGPWGLLRVPEGYVLRAGNEFMHLFTPDPKDRRVYRLTRIWFRNRGTLSLEYSDTGRLVRVIDTAGRVIVFAQERGRIASISVAEPGGASIVFGRYSYDAGGFLVAASDADGNTWRYSYDDDRRLVEMRMPTGLLFHYRYDQQGRCVETWGDDAAGNLGLSADVTKTLADGTPAKGIFHCKLSFASGYSEVADSIGVKRYFAGEDEEQVGKAVTSKGGVTTRTFDAAGNETSVTDANEATSHFKYDALGNLIEETDAEGRVVALVRDYEGRIIEATDPAGGKILSPRDTWGNVAWMQHQNGGVDTFTYDGRGQLVEHIDVRGGRTLYEYDAFGNCIAHTLPNGGVYRHAYDFWGRRIATLQPTGGEYRYAYTNGGLLIHAVDPIGRTRMYEYDALGNVVSDTTPDGRTTRFVYNPIGWPLSVIHPNGERLEQRYNREGTAIELWNEKGERSWFVHDDFGNVIEERLFNGRTRKFTRDFNGAVATIEEGAQKTIITRNLVGQIVSILAPDETEQKFEYDVRGELRAARLPGVEVEWERDPIGKVVRETHKIGDKTYVIENERDPGGLRRAVRTSLGLRLDIRRDGLGDVSEIWSDNQPTLRSERNAMGALLRRDFAGGGAQVDELDPVGRLARRSIVTASQQSTPEGQPEWVGRAPADRISKSYQFTPIDEVASVTTSEDGTTEFEYDVRRALVRKTPAKGAQEAYKVDATGNYLPAVAPRVYDNGDRILKSGRTEFDYDDRGFLLEKRTPRDDGEIDTVRYRWNGFDLLQAVELPDGRRVEFQYDAFARRTAKRVVKENAAGGTDVLSERHFVWDLLNVVHEVDLAGPTRTYLFEDNTQLTPIGERVGNGWLHYVQDLNGTPEEIVDATGAKRGRIERTTFGKVEPTDDVAATTPFRHPGQYADEETGLHYNRYRYYDPELGRFISPDPIGYEGGFNLYAFGPNPIGWFDPMGWAHKMTGSWTDDFETFSKPYQSGMSGDPPSNCPPELKSQAKCHTERKFLKELSDSKKTGGKAKCKGEYPPCPNCHRAMAKHAEDNDTEITYEWDSKGPDGKPVNNSITYKKGQAPVGKGASAEVLTGDGTKPGAYAMTADDKATDGYKFNNWKGTPGAPGASDGYTQEKKNSTAWPPGD